MPVVFDEIVGVVTPEPSTSSEATPTPTPTAKAVESALIRDQMRHWQERLQRLKAD